VITDAMGKTIQGVKLRHLAGILVVDFAGLPDGIYFVWIYDEESKRKHAGKVLKVGR